MLGEHQQLVGQFEGRDFAFIGVNTDEESPSELKKDFEREGVNWRNFILGSTDHPVLDEWQIQAFPTIFVIDKEGVIRGIDLHGDELVNLVEDLLS